MIELFPYQKENVNDIVIKLYREKLTRVLYQLSTGGGKTYVFSALTKYVVNRFKEQGKRVLILCNKEELIGQTIKSLQSIGVTAEPITDKVKQAKHNCEVYVAMVETSERRLRKNSGFFKNVELVICDECHILVFDKLFKYFPNSKILGCTATPVLEKKETFFKCNYCKSEHSFETMCCGSITREWIRPLTMSRYYEDIITGISIKELIEMGRLVPELSFIKKYTDDSKLKTDEHGEFTEESTTAVYGTESAVFNCLTNYQEICEGKKTMVFNSSTTTNKLIYKKFLEAGYNVRMYDSVHNTKAERKELVKWFEDSTDGILCNVGCFTTGFDVQDVEAIILNRPTNSLSLFLQMVGRGGRCTNKIFKPHFIVIDGGNNIERFNEWSDDSRDWRDIFFNGVGKAREKRPKLDITDIQSCMGCGFLMPKNVNECPNCGEVLKPKLKGTVSESDEVMTPIREIPPPDPKKIYEYVVSVEKDFNFALSIVQTMVIDMFKFYRVQRDLFVRATKSGKLKKRVEEMLGKCYYYLLNMNDIRSEKPRKYSTIYNKIRETLNALYKFTDNEITEQANE